MNLHLRGTFPTALVCMVGRLNIRLFTNGCIKTSTYRYIYLKKGFNLDIGVNKVTIDVLSVSRDGPVEGSADESVGQGDVDDDLLHRRLLLVSNGDEVTPPGPPDPPCNVKEE